MLRGEGESLAAARFKLLEPLGAGGFGAVYEAVDARTGQHVAVKQLQDTSAASIARFKHEFRALADCHHENLVGLKELIEQDGRWLIVMDLVPGMDLLQYVRRADNDGFDEQRLRGALGGMVEGLNALHAFGIVHRDLKPSNVRVRPDGRAVLLDFGLATSTDPSKQSTHAMGLGTVLYMAPEQASGQSIGPACDLYALGVCLFEALTGRAPFLGSHAIKIMLDKQQLEAPRASSLVAGVPPDLDELCARLLMADPALRPSLQEVLRILTRAPENVSLRPSLPEPVEEVFAGRDAELLLLQRALARTHEGELRVVLVEGESGVGKSELISEFIRRARHKNPHLVALRGRCYENEQVSYKAFDGCIDELAKVLRRMPEQELGALLPPRAALLGQLFPVLRNVRAIANAPREGLSADPSARRLEAFAALARLLSRLAEERPVVLVLDDLQWADAESFRLLGGLCQEQPDPPILLAGSVRPRDELDRDVRDRLEEVRKWRNVEVLLLSGLPREHAKALASQLLPPGAPAAWLEVIADESSPALLTAIRHHLGISLYFLGDHARFAREINAWLGEARERNDKLAMAMLVTLGYGALRHLMNDDPEQGLRELDQAMAAIPNEPYSFMHLSQMATTTYCHLYRGGPAALNYITEHAAQREDTFLLKTKMGRLALTAMRLLALQTAWISATGPARERLDREAREIIARMSRSRSQQARATAVLALAQLEALAGRRPQALAHARTALSLHRQPTHASVPAVQYLLGLLEGGAAAQEKCTAALAEMSARGWQNPQRALALSAPMIALIAETATPARPSLREQQALLLDRYEVVDALGRGGFGAVVAARDVRNGRRLAIKELTRMDAAAIARFKHEFRVLAELPHENVVQLEALFEHEERWYIAMELVEGVDLTDYARPAHTLDAARLRQAFGGAARGLCALHRAGYVHRDVKPDNVIVSAEGRAVLIDFGLIGRRADTQDMAPVGTPPYAAPEQLEGAAPGPATRRGRALASR